MDCSALPARRAGVGAGRMPDWSGLESGYDSFSDLADYCNFSNLCRECLAGAAERKGMRKAWA